MIKLSVLPESDASRNSLAALVIGLNSMDDNYGILIH